MDILFLIFAKTSNIIGLQYCKHYILTAHVHFISIIVSLNIPESVNIKGIAGKHNVSHLPYGSYGIEREVRKKA